MRWIRRTKKQAAAALREAVGSYELPHFPGTTFDALTAVRDENVTLDRIAETLRVDPGLSVRVLSLVNSAAYGLRAPVDDLSHAVQLVGRSALESLLISVGVRQALPRNAKAVEPRAFWKAAACRAAVARRLAEVLCPSESQRSFTAALLQEMAVPLLAERCGDDYSGLLDRWHDGGPELRELEQESFGWNHAEVGLMMCQVWELPPPLAVAIGGHHEKPASDLDVPAPVLLSAFLRDGESSAGIDALVLAASERHDVERDRLTEILDASFEDAETLASVFG